MSEDVKNKVEAEDTEGNRVNKGPAVEADDTEGNRVNKGPAVEADDTEGNVHRTV